MSADQEQSQSNSSSLLERMGAFFQWESLNTSWQTEVLAGATTFITMAYILVVNPDILSNAIFLQESRDLFGELVIATAFSAAIASLIMGCYAKYPFALAPGMGLNAYFAFSIVLRLGIDWRVALTAVFLEGLIFIGLTLSNIRAQMVTAIPACIKQSTAAGIGLFITYIGLKNGGLIVGDQITITTLGELNSPVTLMAIFGILITSAFMVRRIRGALLLGILATAILAWILGVAPLPSGILAFPQWPSDLFGQAFVGLANLNQIPFWELLAILFVLLFVDLFDTVGTLAGIGMKAGLINDRGELPRASQAFMADAVGTTMGAILGTSTVTTYIESASGISEGGRSGFTSVVCALLFALSIFFIPLISGIPPFATAPALVIIGVLMMGSVRSIHWDDPAESIPSFLTLVFIPLSFSIAEGLAIGFITYPLLKSFQGKMHEVAPAVWAIAAIFTLRFVLMALQIGG
ncbi:NCS2 family permease [Roseofilum reptotaenium]|nr:NCS2 family permease [Roseofilum reptotaenium]